MSLFDDDPFGDLNIPTNNNSKKTQPPPPTATAAATAAQTSAAPSNSLFDLGPIPSGPITSTVPAPPPVQQTTNSNMDSLFGPTPTTVPAPSPAPLSGTTTAAASAVDPLSALMAQKKTSVNQQVQPQQTQQQQSQVTGLGVGGAGGLSDLGPGFGGGQSSFGNTTTVTPAQTQQQSSLFGAPGPIAPVTSNNGPITFPTSSTGALPTSGSNFGGPIGGPIGSGLGSTTGAGLPMSSQQQTVNSLFGDPTPQAIAPIQQNTSGSINLNQGPIGGPIGNSTSTINPLAGPQPSIIQQQPPIQQVQQTQQFQQTSTSSQSQSQSKRTSDSAKSQAKALFSGFTSFVTSAAKQGEKLLASQQSSSGLHLQSNSQSLNHHGTGHQSDNHLSRQTQQQHQTQGPGLSYSTNTQQVTDHITAGFAAGNALFQQGMATVADQYNNTNQGPIGGPIGNGTTTVQTNNNNLLDQQQPNLPGSGVTQPITTGPIGGSFVPTGEIIPGAILGNQSYLAPWARELPNCYSIWTLLDSNSNNSSKTNSSVSDRYEDTQPFVPETDLLPGETIIREYASNTANQGPIRFVSPNILQASYDVKKMTVTNFRLHIQLTVEKYRVFTGSCWSLTGLVDSVGVTQVSNEESESGVNWGIDDPSVCLGGALANGSGGKTPKSVMVKEDDLLDSETNSKSQSQSKDQTKSQSHPRSLKSWLSKSKFLELAWGSVLTIKSYDSTSYRDMVKEYSTLAASAFSSEGTGIQHIGGMSLAQLVELGSGSGGGHGGSGGNDQSSLGDLSNQNYATAGHHNMSMNGSGGMKTCWKLQTKDLRSFYLEMPKSISDVVAECYRKYSVAAQGVTNLFAFAHYTGRLNQLNNQQQLQQSQQSESMSQQQQESTQTVTDFLTNGIPDSVTTGAVAGPIGGSVVDVQDDYVQIDDPNTTNTIQQNQQQPTSMSQNNQSQAQSQMQNVPQRSSLQTGDNIDGWLIYDPFNEYGRMGIDMCSEIKGNSPSPWRLTAVNKTYQLCDSYPQWLVVPKRVNDNVVAKAASFRKKNRIPSLSWCGGPELKFAAIFRSSQTCEGLFGNQSDQDAELLRSMGMQRDDVLRQKLFILDLRTHSAALTNKAGGGGYEDYPFCELEFAGIANIHAVRGSFEGMEKGVNNVSYNGGGSWFQDIGNSQWYENLSLVLQAAANISFKIAKQKRSCLVHCSDGWDRTAQNTTLVMLSLDPYYRTIEGFCLLIQKEWLSFGHRFRTRLATSERVGGEYSPVFIQWLECVYQISCVQYPDQFEFTEQLLLDLVEFTISSRYGTFLGDSEREYTSRFWKYTTSVWTDILKNKDKYKNPHYRGADMLEIKRANHKLDTTHQSYTTAQGINTKFTGERLSLYLPIIFSQARFKIWNNLWFRYHPHLWAVEA